MKEYREKITRLGTLLLFAVFALCVFGLLLISVRSYGRLAENGEAQYLERTAVQYITTRVRQSQGVALEDFQGCEALVLAESADNETYITRVYLWDGYLRELYSSPQAALSPEDGELLLPVHSLDFQLDDGILTVHTGDRQIFLHIPSWKEGRP